MEMKKKYKDEPLSDSRPIIPLIVLGLIVSGISVLGLGMVDIISLVNNIDGIGTGVICSVICIGPLLLGLVLFFSGIRWPRFIRKNFY